MYSISDQRIINQIVSIPESQINFISNNSIVKNNSEEPWQGVDGLISDDED